MIKYRKLVIFILLLSFVLVYRSSRDKFLYDNSNSETTNGSYFSNFNNIVCIGDSLTYSQVYFSGGSREADVTYPEYLGNLLEKTTITLAKCGYKPSDWWNEYESLIENNNSLYIVYLGSNRGLTDTVYNDCQKGEFSETETGYYCKILDKITSNNNKAILLKIYDTGGDLEITNKAIDEIGVMYGCDVIESIYFDDDSYHSYPDGGGYDRIHYNDEGYLQFTKELIKRISQLNSNRSK